MVRSLLPVPALLPALLVVAAAAPAPGPVPAPARQPPAKPRPVPKPNPDSIVGLSGMPVPRFASLSAGQANMRSGPGRQYPVTWTYRRKHLPVEILREWGIWRRVRDPDGAEGWFDKGLLSGNRTLMVARTVRDVHGRADVAAAIVWRAEPGVLLSVKNCAGPWCRVESDGRQGWILRAQTWGSYGGETVG